MANMNVTYADIERTAADLKAGEDSLLDQLNQLKNKVDALVSSGFVTDKASGAFQASYDQFTNGATSTVQGLEGIISFLKKAQQAMQDLDSSLASSLGNN